MVVDDAEETAKRQNRQQEIEEKKKNAPVIDVQLPAQPEPEVNGSETPSPSTETLQTTQVETPEPPKEEKSEASPEVKIEEPKTAAEHREVIDEEQKWLDEHQEADPAEREQHRQRKWASERALGLRDENNNEIAPPPIPRAVEQSPRSATANDGVEKGEPLNESETQSPTAQTEREPEEITPVTEETTGKADAGVTGLALTGEREGLMEITNEDLLNTTTLTEEDLADPEAGALKRAARRNAERQRDDAIAYSRGEIKDKPENYDYWKNRLGLEEPKAENAMQPVSMPENGTENGQEQYDKTPPATREEARSKIAGIVEKAKTVLNKVHRSVVGALTDRQKKDFAANGIDVDDSYVHSVENSAIRHNQKEHGDEKKEAARGQIAITEEDYQLIPDILEDYDTVEKSPNKNKQGNDVIIYTKEYPDGTIYYLEEKRDGRGSLSFETMYKKKKGTDSSDGLMNESSPSTSKTPSDNLNSKSKGSETSVTDQEKREKVAEQANVEKNATQSQERAGLSAKEREIVNRVNAGINDAISDLDAEIRDLEKKGDEEGAETVRLEKEMLENSREDMIDDALDEFNYYEENKGNMTSYEKAAVESRERSLADRKAKRMRELLEKLRDPNTSDAKRRAVVRQLADLGVDASGYLEGRNEIKEIEEPDDEVETPVESLEGLNRQRQGIEQEIAGLEHLPDNTVTRARRAKLEKELAEVNERIAEARNNGGREQRGGSGWKLILTPEETALRDGLVEKMRSAGIEVVTDDAEGQRVLDAALRAEELLDEMKRKSAQETALPEGETSFKGTVISSADGAKVIQNLETLIKNAEKLDAAKSAGDVLFRKGFSRPRGEGHMERVTEGVEKANRQLGGNAKVVREAELGKDVPKNAQAWYDPNTGEVHVVAERVNGAEDASRAVWHEEIGHKAMSEDKINCFLGAECGAVFKKCVTL